MIKADARTYWLITLLATVVCTPLQAADDQVRVVPDSQLKQWWQAPPGHPNAPPQYPIDAVKEGVEGCVAVAFEIHADGSVSNERVWHSVLTNVYSKKEVEQASLMAVHNWRFVPSPANTERVPVYTYNVATFTLDNAPRESKFRANCEMSDFPQQVQAMIGARKPIQKP